MIEVKFKDDTSIWLEKEQDKFKIYPRTLQKDLDFHIKRNPVIAGSYIAEEPNWTLVLDIINNHMFPRQVKDIIVQDEIIKELPYEADVVY